MPKKVECKICGSSYHYQTFCPYKKRKAIKKTYPKLAKMSKKAVRDREFRHEWIKKNPPNLNGNWICYLQISPLCLKRLDKQTLTLEHVVPKGRGIKYRYDENNIKPACAPCNNTKGSRTLESLSKEYPHLKKYIN